MSRRGYLLLPPITRRKLPLQAPDCTITLGIRVICENHRLSSGKRAASTVEPTFADLKVGSASKLGSYSKGLTLDFKIVYTIAKIYPRNCATLKGLRSSINADDKLDRVWAFTDGSEES